MDRDLVQHEVAQYTVPWTEVMHRARATVLAQIQLLPYVSLFDPLAASKARERRSARKGGESTGRASARSRTDSSPLASRRSPTSRARGAGRYRLEEREQGTHSHSRVKRRAYLGSLRKNFSHLPPYNLRATQRLSDMTCNMTVSTAC
jgi:hypothetical protein